MSERRRFLKTLAAGPAGAILLPLFTQTGKESLGADVECAANILGKLPENILYTEARPGVWKGKASSHVPVCDIEKAGDALKLSVETQHGMSEEHYIVRHTVVSDCGKVLGAKTFHWDDDPISTHEIKLGGDCKHVFVMSYCNLHDLWVAHAKLEV
jgi:superoxide reductase